jgi:hypothetical protein
VQLETHWRQWLGTIKAEQLDRANLFLLAKVSSTTLEVLDDENLKLSNQLWWFHTGLLLADRFGFEEPLLLTGSVRDGHAEIRQVRTVSKAIHIAGLIPESLAPNHLATAGAIASTLYEWDSTGGSWRFNKVRLFCG